MSHGTNITKVRTESGALDGWQTWSEVLVWVLIPPFLIWWKEHIAVTQLTGDQAWPDFLCMLPVWPWACRHLKASVSLVVKGERTGWFQIDTVKIKLESDDTLRWASVIFQLPLRHPFNPQGPTQGIDHLCQQGDCKFSPWGGFGWTWCETKRSKFMEECQKQGNSSFLT